jgi:hypothetical protein
MFWLAIPFLALDLLAFDLAAVKNEPNPERRSELATENASATVQAASEAYRTGDLEKTEAAIEETVESVQLAYSCLMETGKDGRRNPKYFKRAELATRQILRRLKDLANAASVEDRQIFENAHAKVSDTYDRFIEAIMGKKK